MYKSIISMAVSIISGRHVVFLPKNPVKSPLTAKTRIFIGFCNGLVCMAKYIAGMIQTDVVQIGVEITVEGP